MSAAALVAAAAMAMPMPVTQGRTVDIPARAFTPSHLEVLVGETVTWTNSDVSTHAVEAVDHSFGSERLMPGDTYARTFDAPGDYRYYCPIHANMRGMVHVDALGLTGPSRLLHPGDTASLSVLAPAGTESVTLERVGGETVATAKVDAAGKASFTVPVNGPVRFRARAGELTSPVVPIAVAPRVTTTVKRRGDHVTVRATLDPALPGATVVLERYVRLRFAYVPVTTARTDRAGHVRFTVKAPRRTGLRVAVPEAAGGWALATSARARA